MQTTESLATGTHNNRTWIVTRADIDWSGPVLTWSWADNPRSLSRASQGAPGDSGVIWKAANQLPTITTALDAAREEQKAKRAAEQAAAQAHAERLAAEVRRMAALLAECESKGRRCTVRFGRLPKGGQSWNHRDDRSEAGVSVYDAWRLPGDRYVLDLRGVDACSAMFIVDRPLYRVNGVRIDATGADGEPLLVNTRARRIHPTTVDSITGAHR